MIQRRVVIVIWNQFLSWFLGKGLVEGEEKEAWKNLFKHMPCVCFIQILLHLIAASFLHSTQERLEQACLSALPPISPLYSFFHCCRSEVSACLDWSFQWPSIAFRIPSLVRPLASFLIIPCLIPHSLNCPGFPQSTSLQNSLLSGVHPAKSYPFSRSQACWRHLFRDACPGHEVPLSLVPYHSVLTPLLSPAFVICPSPRQGRTASFSLAPSRVSDLC